MRKFGLEVEFVGTNGDGRDALIAELRRVGLSSSTREHNYVGHSDTEWVVKRDGSVQGGGELVSPPLDFDNPAQRGQIKIALEAMQRVGCTPSQQAGIHVHVDASDLTGKQVAAVGRAFTKHEDALYRLASSGWTKIRSAALTYAKPMPLSMAKKIAKAKDTEALRTAWYGDDGGLYSTQSHGHASRYYGLNLHSWFYRGTVEFRIFNSSVNPSRVNLYVAVCVAMVQACRDDHSAAIGTAKSLGTMAQATGEDFAKIEDSIFRSFTGYLRHRGGFSLDDLALFRRFWADSKPQQWAA